MSNLYASRSRVGAAASLMSSDLIPAAPGTLMTHDPAYDVMRQRQADAEAHQRHAVEAVAAVGVGALVLTVGLPVLGIILIIKAIKK